MLLGIDANDFDFLLPAAHCELREGDGIHFTSSQGPHQPFAL